MMISSTSSDAYENTNLWKPDNTRWPLVKGNISSIYSPLDIAFKHRSWPREELDRTALAMQAWKGQGHYDGLTGELLHNYISRTPSAARTSKKTAPPVRYRTWAVVRITDLLYKHGRAFRNLRKAR
jgi:hypothetical protein